MANNDHRDQLQDAQGNWWEMLSSPTQVLTVGPAQDIDNKPAKSKRHGNRKLQRFKRKYRKRGLSEEQITTRIQNKNHTISEQSCHHPTKATTTAAAVDGQVEQSLKRKRDQSQQN